MMKRLDKKILLEFLEDDTDVENNSLETTDENIETINELSDTEKENLLLSVYKDLLTKTLDILEYVNQYIKEDDAIISEENKELIAGIKENISVVVGKLNEAIKQAVSEESQNAMAEGESEAQDTLENNVEE